MDDKQDLINIVKEAALPQEVKDDLISRIASQGFTKELAKEVADLLDLQADVLDLEAGVAGQKAQAYEELAKDLENADKEEEDGMGKILDEADKALTEIEKQAGSASNLTEAQPAQTQAVQPLTPSQPESVLPQSEVPTPAPTSQPQS